VEASDQGINDWMLPGSILGGGFRFPPNLRWHNGAFHLLVTVPW
jgi:hypothetical protein